MAERTKYYEIYGELVKNKILDFATSLPKIF